MRIAFAGVSHWHVGLHLNAARYAGAEVTAIWDPNPLVAQQFSKKTGIASRLSPMALMDPRPDLVVVMGRPDEVPAVVLALMEAGLPIVLDKPAVTSTKQLALLMERAEQEALFVAVPLPNRLSPIWTEMARLAAAERLGRISHAHFRIVNGPPERYRSNGVPWILDPAIGGGGALRNLGIHGIDAALAVAGDAGIEVVSASMSRGLYEEAVEEYAAITLKASSGMIVTVEAGYTFASLAPGGDFEWRVSAQNAHLIDHGDYCRIATLDDGITRDLKPIPPGERYNIFMADTLDRLSRGAPPAVGLADYGRAMNLIDRAYEEADG